MGSMSSPSRKVGPAERLSIAAKSAAIGGALGLLTPYLIYRSQIRAKENPQPKPSFIVRALLKSELLHHLVLEMDDDINARKPPADDWASYADESIPN